MDDGILFFSELQEVESEYAHQLISGVETWIRSPLFYLQTFKASAILENNISTDASSQSTNLPKYSDYSTIRTLLAFCYMFELSSFAVEDQWFIGQVIKFHKRPESQCPQLSIQRGTAGSRGAGFINSIGLRVTIISNEGTRQIHTIVAWCAVRLVFETYKICDLIRITALE